MSSPSLEKLRQFLHDNDFEGGTMSGCCYPQGGGLFYLCYDYETNEHGTCLYVRLLNVMNSKRLDHRWVYQHDFEELVDMLIKHDYAPTIRYHRMRMLNLLLDDEG